MLYQQYNCEFCLCFDRCQSPRSHCCGFLRENTYKKPSPRGSSVDVVCWCSQGVTHQRVYRATTSTSIPSDIFSKLAPSWWWSVSLSWRNASFTLRWKFYYVHKFYKPATDYSRLYLFYLDTGTSKLNNMPSWCCVRLAHTWFASRAMASSHQTLTSSMKMLFFICFC